jgi:hypothetical protein
MKKELKEEFSRMNRIALTESEFEIDWATKSTRQQIDATIRKYGLKLVKFNPNGPGGSWPVITVSGPDAKFKKFLMKVYNDDDIDVYRV